MTKQRKYDWPQLFTEFDQSGQSQTDFCKQHNINPAYFSQKLAKRKSPSVSPFSKVVLAPEVPQSSGLILEIGPCKIHCPQSMPIASLVTLVKSLS